MYEHDNLEDDGGEHQGGGTCGHIGEYDYQNQIRMMIMRTMRMNIRLRGLVVISMIMKRMLMINIMMIMI